MNALLNATDPNNRLIEALGSAALFSDTSSASSPLGLPLNALDLAGIGDTAIDTTQPGSATQATTLPDIAALFGAANGNATLTDGLPLDSVLNGLPIIGNNETGNILSGLDLGNLGLGNVAGGGEAPGTATTPLDLAGSGTTLQPVFDATNALIKDVHVQLETLSHEVDLVNVVHGVTNLGETIGLGEIGSPPAADGHSNLITDTLNLPGDILAGNLDGGIANIGHDLTDTVHAATGLVSAIVFDGPSGNDINPVPDILGSVGQTLQTIPLLTINGGNTGDSGLLGGTAGSLTHSSSGHLIDLDVGPQQSNGLAIDLLSAPGSDPSHTVSINVLDVVPDAPNLLDAGVLTGSGGFALPGLGGGGADSLAGNVLGDHGLLGGNLLGGVTGGATGTTAVTTIVAEVADIAPLAGGGDHGLLDLHGTHIL